MGLEGEHGVALEHANAGAESEAFEIKGQFGGEVCHSQDLRNHLKVASLVLVYASMNLILEVHLHH